VRIAARPETPAEGLGLALNLVPMPAIQALYAPAIGRVLHVAARTGLLARLAAGPVDAEGLAAELGLRAEGTRHLLECLGALGHAEEARGGWRLTRRARAWLDPDGPRSVVGYVDHAHDYWDWWGGLEELVREGRSVEIHDAPPGDPSWERYGRGQYELARLSAPEVARALRLLERPRALLDVGGGHGWFAAELCRRHPTLRATVVDLPGSAAVGREVIARAGLSDRVTHREGDVREDPLGGPYDAALLFNVVHHLQPEEVRALLGRVRSALRPGATIAVLDLFARAPDERPDASAFLGLFFHLTSGAATYTVEQLADWLAEAGFGAPRRVALRRLPAQTLLEARTS
jgi:hypothetical protein